MSDKSFDIKNMFNEPDFTVNPQKYIDRLRSLLGEADEYIKSLEAQAEKQEGLGKILYMSQVVFSEYQRELIRQTINAIEFYSK
jgi:hypothetical protein